VLFRSDRPAQEAADLLACALGYRKSYCQHISSDVEYGSYLASFLAARDPRYADLAASLAALLGDLQHLEFTDAPPTRWHCVRALISAWQHAKTAEKDLQTVSVAAKQPVYKILNDNRYEQHSWLWRT
jgi:hypothetical protein